jgi:Protein of unknown function (DUF2905)
VQTTGKIIMIFGVIIFTGGLTWYFFGDKFHWIGRLPGDIRIEKDHFRFYFPITTMVLFSLLITIIMQVIKRLL